MRKTKAISDELFESCKLALKEQGVQGENGRRLQAIMSAKEYGVKEVSKIYNISRETLMRWIRKFKEGGVEAFAVDVGRGAKNKLTQEELKELEEYIVKEGATLSSLKFKLYIEKEYGVVFSVSSAHRIMIKLGFAYITARPTHPKKDLTKQAEFKKKSGD